MLIGYARVSTADQVAHLQTDALTAAGCSRLYVDQASGTDRNRPELARALDQLRDGDVLVVWKLDRLARSVADLVRLAGELEARGVGLRSLTEQLDTSSPGGRFFFHVMSALAELERDLVRERTRAGLEAAKARGARPGRKPGLSPDQVAAARAMLADPALTVGKVAKLLGVSEATLYRHVPGGRSAVQDAPAPTGTATATTESLVEP